MLVTMDKDKNNNMINTREKFGSLAKKVLRYFYDNKNRIFDFSEIIHETQKILKQVKKSIDIVCLYQGIGLITRVEVQKYIYTGFRGISGRFIEFQMNRKRNKVSSMHFQEVNLDGKMISIRSQLLAGMFFYDIFFGLIFSNGKFTTKNQIELYVQEFSTQHKEFNTKTFIPDIINILSMLNFIEKNESTEVITYIGPELRVFDQKTFLKDPLKIQALLKREEIFYSKQQIEIQPILPPVEPQTSGLIAAHISYIPELSFALLKSKNWEHPIKTTCVIIGRSGVNKPWKVDLQLPYKSVSRQHAVILYNFEAKRWQIRCLSHKNLIKVDGQRYAFRDKDIWLHDKSVIQIGLETFMFCMLEKDEKD